MTHKQVLDMLERLDFDHFQRDAVQKFLHLLPNVFEECRDGPSSN